MPTKDIPFADQLSAVCSKQLVLARRDPDLMGEMIERQISSLAFTIAIACKGNAKGLGEMLAGAENHLNEEAARYAGVAQVLETGARQRS